MNDDARILIIVAVAAYSTVTIAITGTTVAAFVVCISVGICCCCSCFFRYWVNTTSSENQLHFSNRERKCIKVATTHSLTLSFIFTTFVCVPLFQFFFASTSISTFV